MLVAGFLSWEGSEPLSCKWVMSSHNWDKGSCSAQYSQFWRYINIWQVQHQHLQISGRWSYLDLNFVYSRYSRSSEVDSCWIIVVHYVGPQINPMEKCETLTTGTCTFRDGFTDYFNQTKSLENLRRSWNCWLFEAIVIHCDILWTIQKVQIISKLVSGEGQSEAVQDMAARSSLASLHPDCSIHL